MFEEIDSGFSSLGFEWNQMLAIVGFDDWTYNISDTEINEENFNWFNIQEANLLMNVVKERAHFFEYSFDYSLNSIVGTENPLYYARWAAMQKFYIDKCKFFVHTNPSYYIKNISTNSDYTIDSNCKHFPTFNEISVNRTGIENISIPAGENKAWFEFCMERGLYGTYNENGSNILKWGFQYANESTNWIITRPGSQNNVSGGVRVATSGDAINRAKIEINNALVMQKYSEALVSDLKKCVQYDFKVKYILDDFGRKNTSDDYIGVQQQNTNTFNSWETSNVGHEGKEYVGDGDASIGTNSAPLGSGYGLPVWKLDFVSLGNSITIAGDDAFDNETNIASNGSKPSFIGSKASVSFDMYMDFLRSSGFSSGEGSYMNIDAEGSYYNINQNNGGYIRFKAPNGATYNLTGEKLLSQITKPENISQFSTFDLGYSFGLQDLSSTFSSMTPNTGYINFQYDFAEDVTFDYNSITADPVSCQISGLAESEDVATVQTSEEVPDECIVSVVLDNPSVSINGSSRSRFGGYAELIINGPPSGQGIIRNKDTDVNQYIINNYTYDFGGSPDTTEYINWAVQILVGKNTPWENSDEAEHYVGNRCNPSVE